MTKKRKVIKGSKQWLKKECNKLFSIYIRRVGHCEKCGPEVPHKVIFCAHIIPVSGVTKMSSISLRYDPMNALSLCYRHHRHWAHVDPLDFVDWIDFTYPGRLNYLRERRKDMAQESDINQIMEQSFTWEKQYEELKSLVALEALWTTPKRDSGLKKTGAKLLAVKKREK